MHEMSGRIRNQRIKKVILDLTKSVANLVLSAFIVGNTAYA